MTPRRVLAVDWSGAADLGAQRSKIWIAEALDGRLVRLEGGRTRDEVITWLLAEAAQTPRLAVGFDFAFSLPAWFLREQQCESAAALWELAEDQGERWIARERPPFWGRRAKRPDLGDEARHWRRADLAAPSVNGIRPKSPFQIGGAGAVGTATLRGMPLLRQLQVGGFRLWPFEDAVPQAPVAFEIWPRLLTGPVVKSSGIKRRAYLTALSGERMTEAALEAAEGNDDAFDAALSALAMSAHADAFDALAPARDPQERLEGRIWYPAPQVIA